MSFEEFVQDCSPRLFRTALLLAGQDRAAAEDLLQLALGRPTLVTPVSTATNKAGRPIKAGRNNFIRQIAITPDGKTAYVATDEDVVVPISTATNTAGKPIRFGSDCRPPGATFGNIAITPDGKTAYVTCRSAVVPISTATNTAGKPIHVPFEFPQTIAISP